ncbi:hypothetical protein [Micromonospora zhanjiangensis]|uniref:MYXO-CTERM domain-containing protein n=1 Tax=Micromonospora zhanjiangensis TaxID=1522057 RepID=A0ABV8KJ41_9ACTN
MNVPVAITPSARLRIATVESLFIVLSISVMSSGVWIVAGSVAAVLAAVAIIALRRRRRAKAGGSDPAMRAARQAIRQSRRDQRRRGRGNLRGEGYGGDDGLGQSAGVTSDGGGVP